jgi:hypothetical protein
VAGLDVVLDEFKRYPVRPIADKHDRDVVDSDYDVFR